MSKGKPTKKILIAVTAVVLVAASVAAYIGFGVIGMEKKRTYPQSTAVEANVGTGKTVLDTAVTYQTMNGFGASACWWSQDVGTWENHEEILSYLYDSEKGIGLNIYRYNLGAGSKGDAHILTENRGTECFLNADGTYDFSKDAAAQTCLADAKRLAGDDLRVTLFCNSAPVSLTMNGAGYGAPSSDPDAPWVTNLDEKNYGAFADYCYNSAEYFLDASYRVTDLSPINEPQYSWAAWYNEDGSYSVNQEGCHFSKTEATALYDTMIQKFKDSKVENAGCKISMFESGSAEGQGSACAAYLDCALGKGPKYVFKNQALRSYFDTVSLHSYWSSAETKRQSAAYLADKYSNYDVVCTEYCQMTNDENTGVFDLISKEPNGTNGMTIDYGTAMAQVILDDLTILNAKEWDWWLGCSYGVYPDGLVYINADNHNDIKTSKRLWCLGNFSKFIDEGAVRVACSSGVDTLPCCAFVNTNGSTVVVYVNNTEEDAKTVLSCTEDYSVYTTSAVHDLEKTASGTAGDVTVSVPAKSVVTVVINEPITVRRPASALFEDHAHANSTVSVVYPVFKDMQIVNDWIADFAASYAEKAYGADYTDLELNLEYTVKRQDSKYISIVFEGTGNVRTAAHPNSIFVAKTFDLQNQKEVNPTDICAIDTHFAEEVYTAFCKDTSIAAEFQKVYPSADALLKVLQTEDTQIYFTEKSVGVSVPVPHAIGDHMETEVPMAV